MGIGWDRVGWATHVTPEVCACSALIVPLIKSYRNYPSAPAVLVGVESRAGRVLPRGPFHGTRSSHAQEECATYFCHSHYIRIMADLEDTACELPWQCYTLPSIAKKGKKKKDKKCKKDKSGLKKDGRVQKKKKKSKLKEAMKGKKDKKKKSKKDRAMKLAVEGDFLLRQANSASHQSEPWLKTDETLAKESAGSHPYGCEQPFLDGSPSILTHGKVTKTKKKVAFELGSGSSIAKYPKVVFPSTQLNVKNVSSSIQSKGVMGSDILVEGALGEQRKAEPQDNNESQCTSDDINSQDLFITQKTFRAPSIDQSSEEITDKMPFVRQYGESQEMVIHRQKEPKKQQEHHREAYEEVSQLTEKASTKSQKLEMELLEKDMSLKPIPCRRIALRSQLKQEAKTIQLAHVRPKRNPYLVNPKSSSSSIDVKKLPDSLVSNQASLEPLPTRQVSTADTSTQTENFFTTELCCYLKFYQQRRLASNWMEVKALDLSLPQRMRTDPGMSSLDSVKTSALKVKGVVGATGTQTTPPFCSAFRTGKHKDFSLPPPSSSKVKVNKGTLDSQASFTAEGKVETTPSPQSEAEPKSSDTTASSEDNEASCRSGRVDLMQVKAVQMRLNESFFFKAKGEGRPPRPESPLMKLIQGREKRNRKR
ncbi:hypothetical protein N1851_033940 [Merluccius polli]|uniref:Uncharacterized protein n=1 Tax=Merluccius polli TaxID=89951 RepID=A0AA47M0R3_MERPO|nr:hypothetical protein N1851_033940 [Merluccius polli]